MLGGQPLSPATLGAMCALWKDRSPTWVALTDLVASFLAPAVPSAEAREWHLGEAARAAVAAFVDGLAAVEGDREGINALFKQVLKAHGLKMPQLAIPLRLLVFGLEQTPSVDAMLALLPAAEIRARVERGLGQAGH